MPRVLQIGKLEMSESSTMSGGKITYLDGRIVNQGNRVVNGITVQVLFRNVAKEVVQNETQPLTFIRTRDPYIDVEPVSAAPLKPGDAQDFRPHLRHGRQRLGRKLSGDPHPARHL